MAESTFCPPVEAMRRLVKVIYQLGGRVVFVQQHDDYDRVLNAMAKELGLNASQRTETIGKARKNKLSYTIHRGKEEAALGRGRYPVLIRKDLGRGVYELTEAGAKLGKELTEERTKA